MDRKKTRISIRANNIQSEMDIIITESYKINKGTKVKYSDFVQVYLITLIASLQIEIEDLKK